MLNREPPPPFFILSFWHKQDAAFLILYLHSFLPFRHKQEVPGPASLSSLLSSLLPGSDCMITASLIWQKWGVENERHKDVLFSSCAVCLHPTPACPHTFVYFGSLPLVPCSWCSRQHVLSCGADSARSGSATWKADRKTSTSNIIVHLNLVSPRVTTTKFKSYDTNETDPFSLPDKCCTMHSFMHMNVHISWNSDIETLVTVYMHTSSVNTGSNQHREIFCQSWKQQLFNLTLI